MSDLRDHKGAIPGPDDITRVQLDNGITVLARENFTSPSVVIDGMVWGGAVWEEKAGLANFNAQMLTRGTEKYTFGDLFEVIESNGASLEFASGYHTLSFSTKSLAEDLALMLDLISQGLRHPTFPETYIERMRGQILTQLQRRADNTRSMAAVTFRELAYPADHPYSRSTNGYTETVSDITREDLVDFHSKIGPQDMIVVVVGAVEADEAVAMVEEAFGDWENPDQPEAPTVSDVSPPAEPTSKFVEIPGKSQSDIVLGFPGPARNAEGYEAARIANSILGVFGLYGRLGDSVREKQGLAYYSFSRLRGGLGPSPWQVIAGVAPQNVEQAVESIRAEISRMAEEPVEEEELADNVAYRKGRLVLGLETNEGVASSIYVMELYNLGLDYLQKYPAMLDELTIEDVQEAAQTYLDPDAYALAVAGPEV